MTNAKHIQYLGILVGVQMIDDFESKRDFFGEVWYPPGEPAGRCRGPRPEGPEETLLELQTFDGRQLHGREDVVQDLETVGKRNNTQLSWLQGNLDITGLTEPNALTQASHINVHANFTGHTALKMISHHIFFGGGEV